MAKDKPESFPFDSTRDLSAAITSLACAVRELGCSQTEGRLLSCLDTINERTKRMASKIQEFADKQNAFNERVDLAVSGLGTDIQALNDKITELQNSPGAITPEDQALLDNLQTRAEGIATKLEALDGLTPPPPPVG